MKDLLIKYIDNINEGDHVVFFDGVNDAIINCQSMQGPNGHGEVHRIRRLISNEKNFFKDLYVRGLAKFKRTNTFTVLNGIGKRIGLQDLKKIDDFKSNYRFEWLRDNVLNEEIPDEIIERRNRWVEDLQKDLYVDEAINILSDLSSFNLNRLSLKNNN